MGARHYRELACWELSDELKRRVYQFLKRPAVARDFEFCDQIRRAARGAPRTIAEGFGRFRPKDFARYLEFARASLLETQNHLGDGFDCGYISADERDDLMRLSDRAIGATTRLHQYLANSKGPNR